MADPNYRKVRHGEEGCRLPPPELARSQPTRKTRPRRPTPPSYVMLSPAPATAAAAAPPFPRYVVRLAGALAALLGRAEGAELPEDELLCCCGRRG